MSMEVIQIVIKFQTGLSKTQFSFLNLSTGEFKPQCDNSHLLYNYK